MIDFKNIILKAISDYKLILRKSLPASQCTNKMHELGIKRQHIRKTDEVGLYKIGLSIIAELKKYLDFDRSEKSSNFYHGTLEFLRYLEEIFVYYRIEDNRVVDIRQKASCALVEAIQLITSSKEKLTKSKMQQIIRHGKVITMYGSEEQKKMLLNAVKEHQECFVDEFSQKISAVLNI